MIDELPIYALYSYANYSNKSLLRQGLACSPLERRAEALQGTLPLKEWPCHPFSSTGLGRPWEFVSLSHNTVETACQWPRHWRPWVPKNFYSSCSLLWLNFTTSHTFYFYRITKAGKWFQIEKTYFKGANIVYYKYALTFWNSNTPGSAQNPVCMGEKGMCGLFIWNIQLFLS